MSAKPIGIVAVDVALGAAANTVGRMMRVELNVDVTYLRDLANRV